MSQAGGPQYGEYASPEEQQKARGLSPPVAPAEQPAEPAKPAAPASPAKGAAHPVDRVVTMVLLACGLFFILSSIRGYLSLPEVVQEVYDSLGAGTYSVPEVASSIGVTAMVLLPILWVATAALCAFAIRRGRLSWWIAVVGGAVAFIVVMVLMSTALLADPGFFDSISSQTLP